MNPNTEDKELNPSGKEPLSEKDFIRNEGSLISMPFWLWIFLTAIVIALIIGTKGWYEGFLQKEKEHEPFLEVTNREFSLFLWQFPSFLRNNVSKKTGYLPGFLSTNENFDLGAAEDFVSAPPDLLFLYHTWHRLLAPEFIARPISANDFTEFMEQLPEWQPQNWQKAPQEYLQLIASKNYTQMENLQTLPESTLPLIVRQAFQGWKNYFKEGSKINEVRPTVGQLKAFLVEYPHYSRPDWRNIGQINQQPVAGSNYLYALLNDHMLPDDEVFPNEQLAPFLKVALFNAEQAKQHL